MNTLKAKTKTVSVGKVFKTLKTQKEGNGNTIKFRNDIAIYIDVEANESETEKNEMDVDGAIIVNDMYAFGFDYCYNKKNGNIIAWESPHFKEKFESEQFIVESEHYENIKLFINKTLKYKIL